MDNTYKYTIKPSNGWNRNTENPRLKCSRFRLTFERNDNDLFASVYRVLTNQRKRIVSPTNLRQSRAFSHALESGFLFLFCFPIVDCVIFVCWDGLSTFALVIRQSLQTRQTTRSLELVKQSKKWVLHSPEVLNRKTHHCQLAYIAYTMKKNSRISKYELVLVRNWTNQLATLPHASFYILTNESQSFKNGRVIKIRHSKFRKHSLVKIAQNYSSFRQIVNKTILTKQRRYHGLKTQGVKWLNNTSNI